MEWLLPGGTLYSMADQTYKSLRLPEGWTVATGTYSPDHHFLALIVVGNVLPKIVTTDIPPKKTKKIPPPIEGPVNKLVHSWPNSTRLMTLDRHSGLVNHSWRLPDFVAHAQWALSWTALPTIEAVAQADPVQASTSSWVFHIPVANAKPFIPQGTLMPVASPEPAQKSCPRVLAETSFQEESLRFTLEAPACSSPPEVSDIYRLVREDKKTGKESILWERRVPADKTACTEPYACYTGSAVQFFSTREQLFLAWDADLYAIDLSDVDADVQLITQLLPQYNRPLAIAPGVTHLADLDVMNKVDFQRVSHALYIPSGDHPLVYAQNFSPTRSFNVAIEVGPFPKSLMVPAGYQVGPVDVGSFNDREYMPLLVTATWSSFHHIVDAVFCKAPYTVSRNTKGIVASLTPDAHGVLQCAIQFQENH